jgi:hypothetical protein
MTMRKPKRSRRGDQRQSAPDHSAGAGTGSEGEQDNHDYTVGYGQPPKQHRFKPGESGNPKGRPKGKPNFQTSIQRALERQLNVKVNGKVRSMMASEAIVEVHVQKALKGDGRAAELILRLMRDHGSSEKDDDAIEVLTDAQEADLADLLDRLGDASADATKVPVGKGRAGRADDAI